MDESGDFANTWSVESIDPPGCPLQQTAPHNFASYGQKAFSLKAPDV